MLSKSGGPVSGTCARVDYEEKLSRWDWPWGVGSHVVCVLCRLPAEKPLLRYDSFSFRKRACHLTIFNTKFTIFCRRVYDHVYDSGRDLPFELYMVWYGAYLDWRGFCDRPTPRWLLRGFSKQVGLLRDKVRFRDHNAADGGSSRPN